MISFQTLTIWAHRELGFVKARHSHQHTAQSRSRRSCRGWRTARSDSPAPCLYSCIQPESSAGKPRRATYENKHQHDHSIIRHSIKQPRTSKTLRRPLLPFIFHSAPLPLLLIQIQLFTLDPREYVYHRTKFLGPRNSKMTTRWAGTTWWSADLAGVSLDLV